MLAIFEAAWEFHVFFTSRAIPYVTIGGIAVQYWGEPRQTRDVDITILIPIENTNYYLELLSSVFETRIPDAKEFARKNRILLLRASNGCDVDISIGLPGYEEELLKRSSMLKLTDDKEIVISSAEDLIVHKAVAGRPQDLGDIIGVINREGKNLDVEYIRKWLNQFSLILETDAVVNRFEQPYQEWQALRTRMSRKRGF